VCNIALNCVAALIFFNGCGSSFQERTAQIKSVYQHRHVLLIEKLDFLFSLNFSLLKRYFGSYVAITLCNKTSVLYSIQTFSGISKMFKVSSETRSVPLRLNIYLATLLKAIIISYYIIIS